MKSALGKSSDFSSKLDSAFGVEFFDSGEQSIFEGDDMELVGMFYIQIIFIPYYYIKYTEDCKPTMLFYFKFFILSDHSAKLDPEILNQKYFARTEELWSSLEASRWWKDD